jgi:multiple sugar transport system permease protein
MVLRHKLARREAVEGYVWLQAWLIGFVVFTFGPMVASMLLGFTDWNGIDPPRWMGLRNYVGILTEDPLFWQSLKVTAVFGAMYLPLSLLIGFAMALLMNQPLRGITVYRTLYYLPSVLSGVAVAVLWGFVFHREYGVLNWVLGLVGLGPVPWLQSTTWALPALVIMELWRVGGSIIIYLAGLQGISTEYYDAAKVDGAGWWRRLWHVTIPMMSPTIFFNLVLGIIGTLQVFTQAYILTRGGPSYATYFYSLLIYDTAFQGLRLVTALGTVGDRHFHRLFRHHRLPCGFTVTTEYRHEKGACRAPAPIRPTFIRQRSVRSAG